mmetsp:Transcript_22364/g.38053  ORF Transcript_22364/g.38053 Transcript_22364/m.38053 type:complete len:399 (-) Transcript_22364:51-1247(-)
MIVRPTQNLLANKAFDIEFLGYLSNHAKHAIVALDRLNASSERIQEWWDQYTGLTPYGLSLHPVDQPWDKVKPCTRQEWEDWRGKKVNWQEMCAFMQTQLDEDFDGNTDMLVKEYAPSLIPGMAGALTHGIIHLGWGIDAQSPWMTIEGLAYLNFAYLGVDPSEIAIEEVGSETPMETILRKSKEISENNLTETWVTATKAKYDETFHSELVPAGFQWQLAKTLHEPHPVVTNIPSWLRDLPLETIWEHLYRTVTHIYLATRDAEDGHGNFLILHGLTSLWGLEHVCGVIGDEETTRRALQQYFAMIVCLLATSTSGFPSVEALEATLADFSADRTEETEWDPIVLRGIGEEEEHNIKLVYVAKELWTRYSHWAGFAEAARTFTLTPNIGPSSTAFKT